MRLRLARFIKHVPEARVVRPGQNRRGPSRAIDWSKLVSDALHAAAPHHLPAFMTAPGESDWLLVGTGILLLVIILIVGNLFLRLHTLPERLAHKSQKLQFEIVAVLGLLALFTHIHAFWVAGLLLALIDLPDFGTPLGRISRSLEKMAGIEPGEDAARDGLDAHHSSAGARHETGGSSTTAAAAGEHAVEAPEKRKVRSG